MLPFVGNKTICSVKRLGNNSWDTIVSDGEFLIEALGAKDYEFFEEEQASTVKAYCEIDVDIEKKDKLTVLSGVFSGEYLVDFIQFFPNIIPHKKIFLTKLNN